MLSSPIPWDREINEFAKGKYEVHHFEINILE